MGIALILGIVLLGGCLITGGCYYWFNKKRMHTLKTRRICLLASVCLFILFIFIPFGFIQIEAGEMAVVKKFGQVKETKTAGLYFRNILFVEYQIYDLKTQQVLITNPVYTKDAQVCDTQLLVQYRVVENKSENIAVEFGRMEVHLDRIVKVAQEKTEVVLTSLTAMELIESRATLSNLIKTEMQLLEAQYYITILNVVLVDISFSTNFEDAVERKMQEQIAVERAEARLSVAELEKQIIVVQANAEAEALKILQEAWEVLTSEIRELMLRQLAIEKWDGKMPDTVVGSDFFELLFGSLGK